MPQDLGAFPRWLKARQPRLEVRDEALVERCWRVHPRFQFLKSLPWAWNVLDIGAGNGGLTHWRSWLKPDRGDLNLYGVDRNPGEFREFYAGWETLDLDREMPNFTGVEFNGIIASHLIEYLDAPERLVAWLGERVKPGARAYLEWTGPSSLDLPTRDELSQHGIEVLTSNFTDDREHKKAPDLGSVETWLGEAGFEVIASGANDLGLLGEELFARAADRDTRSMGYWSLTRSSLYTVAIKSDAARPVARVPRDAMRATPIIAQRASVPVTASTGSEKQALVRELGVEEAFARYRQMSGLPESDRIERRRVANLYEFAKQHGAVFHEIDPSGFAVACLIDAGVRGGSELVLAGDAALFDGPDAEPQPLDGDVARDPAVFHAEAEAAWVIAGDDPIGMAELGEGFLALGSRSGDFAEIGEWLSRYIAGRDSGALPPVPVLIDAGMMATQREAVQRALPPGTDIIELSRSAVTRVRRLWCLPRRPAAQASGLDHYVRLSEAVPGFARDEEAWELARASFVLPPDAVIVEIGAFMGSGTILLAGARKLRGSGFVHVVDPFDGSGEPFSVPVYQRILGEVGGGSLRDHFDKHVRGAGLGDWVEVHQGRATDIAAHWTTPVDMIFFDGDQSRIGVREAYDSWAPFLKPGGVIIVHNSAPGHRPEQEGSRVLVEEEVHPPAYSDIRRIHSMTVARNGDASTPRLFSYWDKPDLTPVQPTLDDWQSHFPEFTIFGDPDVEPVIEELFPQHLDLFRSIRIPTCKSDLALLLLLYKHGGLYVDCHCGIRDAAAIRELLASLDQWELILYDKHRGETPRPDDIVYPLNSVIFSRARCELILRALTVAFRNLAAHRSAERERGFRPYHVGALTGPDVLGHALFEADAALSPQLVGCEGRVRLIPEDGAEPIARYMHYQYRVPGMHWSERQRFELLFVEQHATDGRITPVAHTIMLQRPWPIKLSVLLLTYNQVGFVAQALDGALMQETDFDFEIIAADDASSDGTQEVLIAYAKRYPDKIRLLLREKNLGRGGSENFLQSVSGLTGQYIATLEGDDYWVDRHKLQRQVAFLDENPEFSGCTHNHIMKNEWTKTERLRFDIQEDATIPLLSLIEGCMFQCSTIMWRNGLVNYWPKYFKEFEFDDWPLQVLLAERGHIRFFADVMSVYRIHSGGVWSQKYRERTEKAGSNEQGWKITIDFWRVLDQHFNNKYSAEIENWIEQKVAEFPGLISDTVKLT